VADNDEGKQALKAHGWNHAQVNGSNRLRMVAQERPPALRRRTSPSDHISGHRRLGELESKLEQFTMDAGSAPHLNLVSVLSNGASIAAITPADNAGLGLARAVSVVEILRQSKELAGYKILPLSGGQLINTDETLALGGNLGDIRERRRIEIRLRKATPRVIDQPQQQTGVQKLAKPVRKAPLRPPKPAKPTWTAPFVSGPMQIVPLSLRFRDH
jgi:hypothetical protein